MMAYLVEGQVRSVPCGEENGRVGAVTSLLAGSKDIIPRDIWPPMDTFVGVEC